MRAQRRSHHTVHDDYVPTHPPEANAATAFSSTYRIDYFRVYQR